MKNLIGVGVADAAEQPRVGESTLHGVVLPDQSSVERLQRRVQHVEPARVMISEAFFTAHQEQRSPFPGTCLGEQEGACRKIERGKAGLFRDLVAGLLPAEPPRDHQVHHEKELVIETEYDAFADAAKGVHYPSFNGSNRRVDGAEDERAGDPHVLHGRTRDMTFERFDVHRDVGKFGHRQARGARGLGVWQGKSLHPFLNVDYHSGSPAAGAAG